MIASVDESVGRVLAKLEELGLAANTVVIFSSDNGGVHTITSNAPLRGGKGMLYEGGLRVPFIVRWPSKTPPGSTCPEPGVHVDLFPTFLELARARRLGKLLTVSAWFPCFRVRRKSSRTTPSTSTFPATSKRRGAAGARPPRA